MHPNQAGGREVIASHLGANETSGFHVAGTISAVHRKGNSQPKEKASCSKESDGSGEVAMTDKQSLVRPGEPKEAEEE